jgi:GH35 family endo-1,4-beta-xylanase
MDGNSFTEIFLGIENSKAGVDVPCIILPGDEITRFFMQWTVPAFGNIVLPVDNAGAGYTGAAGEATILNLNYELARSQLNRLETNINDYDKGGYSVGAYYFDEARECGKLLSAAAELSGAETASISDEICAKALWALEELELERAEDDIEKYRKGRASITIVDADGRSVSGAKLSYKQSSHDFLFGVFDTMENIGEEGFSLMKNAGVNFMTAGFYWDETEPRQNKINWDIVDNSIGVKKLHKMGFKLKAHALIALWDFAMPDYLAKMEFDELNDEIYEHISALVSGYKDNISIWNVINEAHYRGAARDFSREQITTLTRTGIDAVRKNAPGDRIIINSSHDWFGESSILEIMEEDGITGFTISIPAYIEQLEKEGVDYDIIGQQLYNGGYVSLFDDWDLGEPIGVPTWDIEHLSGIMDKLGTYGKPVHITEQSVPSAWDSGWADYGTGWWHREWDEETQAEFIRWFYTIVFSKEYNEALTWWNINDNNSFIKFGGLLDDENKPKASYFALKSLIESWTTRGTGSTDTSGIMYFSGYGGDYEITLTQGNESYREVIHIEEQKGLEYTIRLTE